MKKIGFIGLGTMGAPMAANLLKNGFSLTVHNRSSEKADPLLTLGAEWADSPAEAVRASDIIITMLADDASVEDVYYGNGGIMEGLQPGHIVIDSSTISPDLSVRIHADAVARFADFLDAPVTGSKPAAIEGTLIFMVGGKPDVLEKATDALNAMGRKIVHMGPGGAGSQTKLAHNTIVGINMAAFAEGIAMAAKAGVAPDQFVDVVLNGAANSRQAELKAARILSGDFSVQFGLGLMLKDLNLASRLATEIGAPSPMLDAARSLFRIAETKGLADDDLSSVVKCYEQWNGLQVRHMPPGHSSVAAEETAVTSSIVEAERRRNARIPLNVSLKLSVYQWEQEGDFQGQTIDGTLVDLSESGLQIASTFPLAQDMFIVIHFPQEAKLPPITGKIIRIASHEDTFHYGCMLSGLPPFTRKQLEQYIAEQSAKQT